MKTIKTLGIASAALLLAGALGAQTTTTTTSRSVRDNPGVLGHGFSEVNYSWVDFSRDRGVDADGFIAGVNGNVPVSRGFDVGLGYDYYRENGHRNPFTNTDFDARYHQLSTSGTLFAPMTGLKPFLTGGLGYQWSRGDIQRLRAYDSMWLWGASAGAEIPLGVFSFTPRVGYSDSFDDNGLRSWHYSGELHHWFTERMGGYLNVAFHEPRNGFRPDAWTYTAGLRMKF